MSRLRLASTLFALALALPALAHAGCELHTLEMPVRMAGTRAVATVGINGTAVPLTVDSGAHFSFLTEAAAAQLKLHLVASPRLYVYGITGDVDVQTTIVDKLQLLKGEIPDVQFIVGGNEPGAGTMGLMGRNLLAFTDTEYDLAHGMIRFHIPSDDCAKANLAYWAGATPVSQVDLITPFGDRTPPIRARAKLNGSSVVVLFDTGATTLVSTRAARRAGVTEADMTRLGTFYGLGRGSGKAWTATFDRFELGGEAVLHNRLEVGEFKLEEADILLGIDFFLSHRIYVSTQQQRMFFTYAGGNVFALDKSEGASAAASDAAPAASDGPAANAEQLARLAAALAARHDYEGALADLNQACALEPTQASCFAQRGAIQATMKRPAKAIEDFDKALALDPAQADARYGRAWLRFYAKDLDGSKADADALDKTVASQAAMRFSLARLYQLLEQPRQALAQLNQWLAAHPHEHGRDVALNSRCWTRVTLGIELNEALDDCKEAIAANPKNAAYRDSRGWLYLRLGQYTDALSDFDLGLQLRPEAAWSLYGRGLARKRLGDAVRGDADLAAARKIQPDIDAKVAQDGLLQEPTQKR